MKPAIIKITLQGAIMKKNHLKQSNRYINDLRRMNYQQGQVKNARSGLLPFAIAAIFLIIAGIYGSLSLDVASENIVMLVAAAIIGGYMALNIGANDVANNMGPAVGGKVLTVTAAVVIAAVCESAGAILAGGDVVKTVAKGIINPGDSVTATDFRNLM
ncbi:inorganic phosphate transporter, partial [Alphaproteobacteria bacterium]|nr:inorganic phosphate transporter [Alphaproteobacteria bacterium]